MSASAWSMTRARVVGILRVKRLQAGTDVLAGPGQARGLVGGVPGVEVAVTVRAWRTHRPGRAAGSRPVRCPSAPVVPVVLSAPAVVVAVRRGQPQLQPDEATGSIDHRERRADDQAPLLRQVENLADGEVADSEDDSGSNEVQQEADEANAWLITAPINVSQTNVPKLIVAMITSNTMVHKATQGPWPRLLTERVRLPRGGPRRGSCNDQGHGRYVPGRGRPPVTAWPTARLLSPRAVCRD